MDTHAEFDNTEGITRTSSRKRFPLRFVTAASLFDGHDAAINVVRRLLQAAGAEVIHLGHNRSVEEVVTAAIHEDAHAIALSSYQGGHLEYFRYALDMLRKRGAGHIRIFGGGGGVIIPEEVRQLHDYGITRIYTPDDGQKMGLKGMVADVFREARKALKKDRLRVPLDRLQSGEFAALSRAITCIERGLTNAVDWPEPARTAPVLGITGTGGSGKSSLTDELVRRFRLCFDNRLRIAVIAVDPTRRRTGGALLGDRIRMNAIGHPGIFMRSLGTRTSGREIPSALPEILKATQLAGFDLIIVETSGIGQGDAAITAHADASLYVMTPEFGAATQLEKTDMLDFADVVAINKFDRKGAADALRDVRKQMIRNREAFGTDPEAMPVYGAIASKGQRRRSYGAVLRRSGCAERERLRRNDGSLGRSAASEGGNEGAVPFGSRHPRFADSLPGRNRRDHPRLSQTRTTPGESRRGTAEAYRCVAHAGGCRRRRW